MEIRDAATDPAPIVFLVGSILLALVLLTIVIFEDPLQPAATDFCVESTKLVPDSCPPGTRIEELKQNVMVCRCMNPRPVSPKEDR